MFEQILRMIPSDPNGVLLTTIVAIAIGIGSLTALLGALHSRATMALVMLGIGALLGFNVPRWLQWDLDVSVMISISAVVFGLVGFLLHRVCVACLLGTLVACVSLAILADQTQPVEQPAATQIQQTATLPEMAAVRWSGSPAAFRSAAPWVAMGTYIAFALIGLIFPRFGMAALYALGGTLLTLSAIKLGHASDQIHWLDSFKTGPMTTAAMAMTLLLVGFLVQMALLFRPGATGERKKPSEELELAQ